MVVLLLPFAQYFHHLPPLLLPKVDVIILAGKSCSLDPQHAGNPASLLALQGRRPSPQVRPVHPHGEQGQARPDAAQHSGQPLQVRDHI